MRSSALVGLAMVACSFNRAGPEAGIDAGRDPPASPQVRFVSVTSSVDVVQPGLYGIEVVAVLRNDLPVGIGDIEASLTFADDTTDRAGDFRWRDADARDGVFDPQPTTIAAGGEATYRFQVDALASAIPPGPIAIGGTATFASGGTVQSATPLDPPMTLAFIALNAPIVVTTAVDEDAPGGETCFREALQVAAATTGLDRIVFDPDRFPPGATTLSLLDQALGELPAIDGAGGDLVIDGSGAGFHLAVDDTWETPEGRYGLRLTGGTLVVYGIGFRNLGYNYRNEGSLDADNCGPSGAQLEGGAIRVDGGTLVLDGNVFADRDVAERNCFAASVRLHAGSGHRILNNHWTESSMDAIYIDAAAIEVTGNVLDAGASLSRTDECFYVNRQAGHDLWITGNLCVDQEFSAVVGRGSDGGTLYIVHNTFVRNGRSALSAVRREEATRAIVLRNNVYIANNPSAVLADGGGAGFDLAHESVSGSTLCDSTCPDATIDALSMLSPTDPRVANPGGSAPADFAPLQGSPLIDSAVDWLDRTGSEPGRYRGAGPERGAVELP